MTDSNKSIRTRFAPSPTGFVHIGSLRTALFAFLFARHNGGVNVLRVEDTDQSRLVDGAVENMIKVLGQLGVEFDEGPLLNDAGTLYEKGEFGPYTQSARLDIYKQHIQTLLESKKAYFCFCSSERLDELRKEQVALKKPPMYDRHCRNLTNEEVQIKQDEFKEAGKNPVVRFAIPQEGTTIVNDLVFGEISYKNEVLDDQVLLKSDGFPTYHLAVVVDDHLMQISHVVRGEDWVPSTPKHVLLYQAFGWEVPVFAHLPLILNQDKSKLSKRQGDVAVEDFLQKGYLPEAFVNFVAFLGWNPKTEQEIFSLADLIREFDLKNVNKSGAVFDNNKLDWMNSEYIRTKTPGELVALCEPFWPEAEAEENSAYLEAIVQLEKDRLKTLSEISERTRYFFQKPEYEAQILIWKKSDAATTKQMLHLLADLVRITDDETLTSITKLEEKVKAFIVEHELDNGTVLWPLRVAMTGLEKSPNPFEVTAVLALGQGRDEVASRLEAAILKLT